MLDTPTKRRGRPKKVVEEEITEKEKESNPVAKRGRKPTAAKTEPEIEADIEEVAEIKPKRGRKAAASKTEAKVDSPVEETKAKRGRKAAAAKTAEKTEEVPTISPVK